MAFGGGVASHTHPPPHTGKAPGGFHEIKLHGKMKTSHSFSVGLKLYELPGGLLAMQR